MKTIDLARHVKLDDLILTFRECTPRLLVVTDGALNAGNGGFGLSQFVATLQGTTIHGMTPIVTTRDRGPNDEAFDDLLISRFDVVFLFGYNGEGDPLTPDARARITTFMQAGGGVFATGDHEDLGAGMCGQLPRVRHMRYWSSTETPDAADTTRLTTNLPGVDRIFTFGDQSDAQPQRLYANYNIPPDFPVFILFPPSNVKRPHPLLRMADGSALDVYPDHPHEGECRLPDDLTTMIDVDGTMVPEWPGAGTFVFFFPAPRLVASTMSFGNGFDNKQAVVPRAFIAIAAYNGQARSVGRVVTDATWHHYVNINFNGFDPTDVNRIHRYWSNLANWLMPAQTRKCLFPVFVLRALLEHPLAEEIRIPAEGSLDQGQLAQLGEAVATALESAPGAAGGDVLNDVISVIIDPDRLAELTRDGAIGQLSFDEPARDAGLAVLGETVVALVRHAASGKLEHYDDLFDTTVKAAVGQAREALVEHRAVLEQAAKAADVLGKVLIG